MFRTLNPGVFHRKVKKKNLLKHILCSNWETIASWYSQTIGYSLDQQLMLILINNNSPLYSVHLETHPAYFFFVKQSTDMARTNCWGCLFQISQLSLYRSLKPLFLQTQSTRDTFFSVWLVLNIVTIYK